LDGCWALEEAAARALRAEVARRAQPPAKPLDVDLFRPLDPREPVEVRTITALLWAYFSENDLIMGAF